MPESGLAGEERGRFDLGSTSTRVSEVSRVYREKNTFYVGRCEGLLSILLLSNLGLHTNHKGALSLEAAV